MADKKESLGNLLVPDTNVLISDSDAIFELVKGNNTVILPFTVICELDKLKTKSTIGSLAQENIKKINTLQKQGNKSFKIEKNFSYEKLKELDPANPDHEIIAIFNSIVTKNIKKVSLLEKIKVKIFNLFSKQKDLKIDYKSAYNKIKLLSNDNTVIILAREIFAKYGDLVSIEYYRRNLVKAKLDKIKFYQNKKIVPSEVEPGALIEMPKFLSFLKENDGVICQEKERTSIVMRKGKNLKILNPDINVAGIRALPLNGSSENYSQILALHQLTDKSISCVFLGGGAGTGKTLLAIAAGVSQCDYYENIIIMRPMVHLSDKDNMGFLPGDVNNKMSPWLKPIEYNLKFIHKTIVKNKIQLKIKNGKKKKNDDDGEKTIFDRYNVEILPLDYIRGLTLPNSFVIIDESQNLTGSQFKTIITRAGRNSKFVFTGDLSQIDVKYLNSQSSGLAHAISKLHDNMPGSGNSMIASTIFVESLRSDLATLGVKYL